MEHTKRDYSRKIDAVINQGSDNFALLDDKLNNLEGKILRTTIDMMTQAEAKISEMGMDKEALGKLVDRLAEKAFEKHAELANGKRRKKDRRKRKEEGRKRTKAPSAAKDDDNLSDDEVLPNQDPADSAGEARFRETKEENT